VPSSNTSNLRRPCRDALRTASEDTSVSDSGRGDWHRQPPSLGRHRTVPPWTPSRIRPAGVRESGSRLPPRQRVRFLCLSTNGSCAGSGGTAERARCIRLMDSRASLWGLRQSAKLTPGAPIPWDARSLFAAASPSDALGAGFVSAPAAAAWAQVQRQREVDPRLLRLFATFHPPAVGSQLRSP